MTDEVVIPGCEKREIELDGCSIFWFLSLYRNQPGSGDGTTGNPGRESPETHCQAKGTAAKEDPYQGQYQDLGKGHCAGEGCTRPVRDESRACRQLDAQ